MSRTLRFVGHVESMGEVRVTYRVLVGKSEERTSLGRPRCKWENNIKTGLRDVG
jgi:hypothetical protein